MSATKEKSSTPGASAQATQLATKAAQHVLAHGLGDLSLRGIAPALDTSHRMLIYHFGSADLFWEAVLREIRHTEQERRARLVKAGGVQPDLETEWDRFASEEYLPIIKLLFEIYGRAIRDTQRYADFLEDVVSSWVKFTEASYVARGVPRQEARVRARLQVAVVRGLLLDLVTTGERKQTTAALKYFVQLLRAAQK